MEKVKKIEEEITFLEKEFLDAKGRETEVYTRIVGYYRAVKNWNKGKREEYNHRVCFSNMEHADTAVLCKEKEEIVISCEQENRDEISSFSYFYRKTCPNCPAVKKHLDKLDVRGESIDVDTPEGISLAKENGILSVPTVIFSSTQGKEVYRVRNVKDLQSAIPSSMLCAV